MTSINELSKRTDAILEAAQEAARILRRFEGRCVNGWGILSDPSLRYSDLYDAKKKIDAAIELHVKTKWPYSDADYERLEVEHNRRASHGGGQT
jgi:hypothetical protein